MGKETARGLLARGWQVILLCRNPQKGREAVDELQNSTGSSKIKLVIGDLANKTSLEQAARSLLAEHSYLNVLINNAGLLSSNQRQTTDEGLEHTFGVNHLGHFYLSYLLLPLLKEHKGSRIINVSSEAHRIARFSIEDLQLENQRYNGLNAYAISKLCNLWFTFKAANLLDPASVTVNALHPGMVNSNFAGNTSSLFAGLFNLVKPFSISSREGAKTPIYLASSPQVAGTTGCYFRKEKIRKPSSAALNPSHADYLWQYSQELLGIEWIA